MQILTVVVLVALGALAAVAHENHDSHPKYEFKYGVKDLKTGDIKDQWEHRDGDHVRGSYSVKESDGTTRVVDYHADGHSGFHADVKKIGHAHHPDTYQHHHDVHNYAPHHVVVGWTGDHYHHAHGCAQGYVNALGYAHGYDQGQGYAPGHGHATSYVNIKRF